MLCSLYSAYLFNVHQQLFETTSLFWFIILTGCVDGNFNDLSGIVHTGGS